MCTRGVLKGTYHNTEDGTSGAGVMSISCGSWKCEECRTKKAREVLARALKGMIAEDARKSGFREQYNFKTLALTYPGGEFRVRYTREQAAVQMRDAFRKLIVFLRKQLGYFSYIRVTEDEKYDKDGNLKPEDQWYPHYHANSLRGKHCA